MAVKRPGYFFVVGAQKAGTTALSRLLQQHPHIQMTRESEPHFFDNDFRFWYLPFAAAFERRFPPASAEILMRGDSTPAYIYWPRALERIRRFRSDSKLVVLLRHPGFRAFSHWRMETTRGAERRSFSAAIREGRRRVGNAHRIFSYVERGLYAGQIEQLLKLFPRDALHMLRTDTLWSDQHHQMGSLFRFLGVADMARGEPAAYASPLIASVDATFLPSDRRYLDALFRDDIVQTAALTGLDLGDWLAPDYEEPMQRIGAPTRR